MTIVVKEFASRKVKELLTGVEIPRRRNFYKSDRYGYYYIPEVASLGA